MKRPLDGNARRPKLIRMRGHRQWRELLPYVRGYGFVEIGDQQSFGFVVRAIGYGGLDFEEDTPDSPAEAMTVLEAGLARCFEEQGGELN